MLKRVNVYKYGKEQWQDDYVYLNTDAVAFGEVRHFPEWKDNPPYFSVTIQLLGQSYPTVTSPNFPTRQEAVDWLDEACRGA